MLLHLQDRGHHIDHKAAQKNHAVQAGESALCVGNDGIEDGSQEEGSHREPQGLFVDQRRTDGNGQSRDQTGVADDRSDGVAIGNAAVVGNGCLCGNHDLRQRGADGNHRRANEELRQVKAVRQAGCTVHKPVTALDQQSQSENKQQYWNKHCFFLHILLFQLHRSFQLQAVHFLSLYRLTHRSRRLLNSIPAHQVLHVFLFTVNSMLSMRELLYCCTSHSNRQVFFS